MGKRKTAPTPDVTEEPQQTPGGQKPAKQAKISTETPGFKNKEKVLLLSSRGITHRQIWQHYSNCVDAGNSLPEIKLVKFCCRPRHLMLDLAQLLPHCKRDAKLDTKTDRGVINEVADMKVRIHKEGVTICNPALKSWAYDLCLCYCRVAAVFYSLRRESAKICISG